MSVQTARELLGLGSWKRALVIAAAVLLALLVVTVEGLVAQEATTTHTFTLEQAVSTALLGDVVEVSVPRGTLTFKIMDVKAA